VWILAYKFWTFGSNSCHFCWNRFFRGWFLAYSVHLCIMLVVTACSWGSDIVIAVDTSGSIGENKVEETVKFLELLINALYVEGNDTDPSLSRIGLVTFSDSANIEFQLNTYSKRTELLQAINIQYVGGTTNTPDAIRYSRWSYTYTTCT